MKSLKMIAPISSLICAIHCVATPLAMAILPYVSISLFITEFYDWLLLSFSLLFNVGNLCFGFKKHKSYKALKYLGIGIGFLLVAKLEHHHEKVHHGFDPFDVVMIVGAIFILFSSILNEKLCNNCKRCNELNCNEQKN
jgi:hypothetical protein